METENIKAIYFDLDDTLCGYISAAHSGLRKAFKENLLDGLTLEEMVQSWVEAFAQFYPTLRASGWYERYLKCGETTRTEVMRIMLSNLGVNDPKLAKKLSHEYSKYRLEELSLFPGAKDCLENLHGKYKLGLMTNGPADVQRDELKRLGIEKYFDCIFIEGELGFGKPDKKVFGMAEDAVGCSPHEILMIGNSYRHDILPAIEKGWNTCWIHAGNEQSLLGNAMIRETPDPNNLPKNPDKIVTSICEIFTSNSQIKIS